MPFGVTVDFVQDMAQAAQIILQLEGQTTYPSTLRTRRPPWRLSFYLRPQ